MTSSPTIAIDQLFPYPPARIWQALTDPDLLARWLMPTDFYPKVGHHFTFKGTPMPNVKFSGIVQGEVLAFGVERTLSYSWADHAGTNDLYATVTWHLEPEGQGTHLFLEQGCFDPTHPLLHLSYQIMSGGWVSLMRQLTETRAADDAVPPSTST